MIRECLVSSERSVRVARVRVRAAPLTVLMCKHWGCRAVTMVGSLLATLALVLSAAVGVFGNDAPHELRILLGTHGVIGGTVATFLHFVRCQTP